MVNQELLCSLQWYSFSTSLDFAAQQDHCVYTSSFRSAFSPCRSHLPISSVTYVLYFAASLLFHYYKNTIAHGIFFSSQKYCLFRSSTFLFREGWKPQASQLLQYAGLRRVPKTRVPFPSAPYRCWWNGCWSPHTAYPMKSWLSVVCFSKPLLDDEFFFQFLHHDCLQPVLCCQIQDCKIPALSVLFVKDLYNVCRGTFQTDHIQFQIVFLQQVRSQRFWFLFW